MENKYAFTGPGCYRIEVQGPLRAGWSGRFGAMQVLAGANTDETVSVLQGCVSDQTELSGILNSLYELHMSLISVQYLGDAASAEDTATE